jgi:hypothetical protein
VERGELATAEGRVKFFTDRGWGGIEGSALPGDVWFHLSHINAPTRVRPGVSYISHNKHGRPAAGDRVSVTYKPCRQDSWRYCAVTVRFLDDPEVTAAVT